MTSVKKWLFFCLVLLAAASTIFVGCSRSKEGSSAKTLELWHIQSTDPGPALIQGSVDRFIKANPDIKVNVSIITNDAYKQKLAVAMTSGKLPDIFISWSGGPMYEYAKAGTIIDISPYLNTGNKKAKYLDAAIAQVTWNGKIWGIPVENVSVCSVFYNKEIFARFGLAVPTTISELEQVCDTLLANGIIPFSLANKTQWTGSMYFMFFATRHGGVEPFIKGVDGSGTFTDPTFVYAGQKIAEWVQKGYFNPGFNGLDEDSGQSRQLLYTGDAAMTIMGSWFISTVSGENPDFVQKMGAFPFPRDETGTGNPATVIGTIGDNFYHISKTCAIPDKAFELLDYLLDDQAVKDRIAAGRIPPVKTVTLTDPILSQLFEQVKAAPDIQLWYDQSLSPEVAEVHKTTSQEIFGGTMTPEIAAQRLQEAQAAYLKK
ncbi:MAG: extracellular solute-binding protein [Treponema sp.]|jgi:raffinose/stachyose/melibiose transport system substrate-binding protein|nr:extracellular solute-binding protein [Treponema sp.]